MSIHTFEPDSSPLDQIGRGLVTGIRWFFRLLFIAILLAAAGLFLFKLGGGESGEADESVQTHHDIRRNIALGVNGPSAPSATGAEVESWKPLAPSVEVLGERSQFESRVEIKRVQGGTAIQVAFGPYEVATSHRFKESSGWVTLDLLGANGMAVAGVESSLRIPLKRFEYHQERGLPVGWIYRGILAGENPPKFGEIKSYKLGWVLPSSASTREDQPIGMR